MVGEIIIVVVFLVVATAIVYGASRGSFKFLGKALARNERANSRLLTTSLVVVYVGVGIFVPIIFTLGNRDNSNAQVGGLRLTAAMQAGRELFAEHCAICHTLAADNAVGQIGPNLDILKPSEATVMRSITYGCLQKPVYTNSAENCLGYGTMQADIVEGTQAQDIAEFVAAVAGRR
jgi:cytochrome c553